MKSNIAKEPVVRFARLATMHSWYILDPLSNQCYAKGHHRTKEGAKKQAYAAKRVIIEKMKGMV